MNFKQIPVISEILPAFYMFGLLTISFWESSSLLTFLTSHSSILIFQAATLLISAWIVGSFFDAFRNGILESFLNNIKGLEINWPALYGKVVNRDRLKIFEENYYEFYSLDVNFITASVCFLIFSLLVHCSFSLPFTMYDIYAVGVALVFSIVFGFDAFSMRSEMSEMSRDGF